MTGPLLPSLSFAPHSVRTEPVDPQGERSSTTLQAHRQSANN